MVQDGKLPLTPRGKRAIELALQEARDLNHHKVEPEHLLIGLWLEQDGVAAQILLLFNLRIEDLRREVANQ